MRIPLRAGTYDFVPATLSELDGAPTFTFRHGTRADKDDLTFNMEAEGLRVFTQAEMRGAVIDELRKGWESDGLEQNITRLEAYWQATDDFALAAQDWADHVAELRAEAEEGEEIELPEQPVLDFDKEEEDALNMIVEEVMAHSRRLNLMTAQKRKTQTHYPRLILRMLIKESSLDVALPRRAGLITKDAIDELIEALVAWCNENDADPTTAYLQLVNEAHKAFQLREDEEKNSSAVRSGSTPRKASTRRKSTSRKSAPSKTPASSAKASGKA